MLKTAGDLESPIQSIEDQLCRNKRENFRMQLRNDSLNKLFSQNRDKSMKKIPNESKRFLSFKLWLKFCYNKQGREEVMLQEENVWDNYQKIYKIFKFILIESQTHLDSKDKWNGNNQQEGEKIKGKVVGREGGINLNIYCILQYKLEHNQKQIISARINYSYRGIITVLENILSFSYFNPPQTKPS